MLRRLHIRNYGLVRDAAIDFADGATMFTGETGSGKTMILGALGFALGARSSADAVGAFGDRAFVSLEIEPGAELTNRFAAADIELDPGELATIEREMTSSGKSSVRIAGRAATASLVRDVAAAIAEIVGQHEAQRLLSSADHGEMLDRFGGSALLNARARVREAHAQLVALERERDAAASEAGDAQARYDRARAALDDIDAAVPLAGEDELLEQRRHYLDNAERIAVALQSAHDAIAGEEYSSISGFGVASTALDGIASFSPELAELAKAASALQEEASDLAVRIAREADASDFDARELESINERLSTLDTLKRRYGPTLGDVLAHAASARETVESFEHRDERLAALTAAIDDARDDLTKRAKALTTLRTKAASQLAEAVHGELGDLALAAAKFELRLVPQIADANGAETVEFYFSANPGEPSRPLARVASGGELSRVLLALIVATLKDASETTLIFDEIDAGIGGATGTAVGARLGRLARVAQVVCVTHLAQLATWADRHYVLEKSESNGRTIIGVRELLGKDERAAELARMLSGASHGAALAHAHTLLEQSAS